jgi:hypothetical protein
MVFIQNANVVKGNGDLGWHVDDGIGGHPVMCPLIQAGIQLDPASAANGQLLVLAGSHRYTKHWHVWGDEGNLPVVALDTEPGDVTLHYGDIMHTTPPPTALNAVAALSTTSSPYPTPSTTSPQAATTTTHSSEPTPMAASTPEPPHQPEPTLQREP